MSRLLTDVEQIQLAFGSRLADFAQGALTIVFVLAYVFSLNARLSFVVFVVTPVILVSIVENARRLRRTAISSRERIGEMGTRLSEVLKGNRVIKTYGMEDYEAERLARGQRPLLPREPPDGPDPGPQLAPHGDPRRPRPRRACSSTPPARSTRAG